VPGNEVVRALRCLVPQGINGCAYGSPLEAMLRALDPAATWNQGPDPFLRPDAILAVAIVTDTYDCSVRGPEGHAYFTDPILDQYWAIDPETDDKSHATPAVCWNASVECDAPDSDGVHADCVAVDREVLHPLDRYAEWLRAQVVELDKPVVMLDLLGVPSVTAHAPTPPSLPSAGGMFELVYRDWREGPFPDADQTIRARHRTRLHWRDRARVVHWTSAAARSDPAAV
jgi:hypothetical protein